MQVTKIMNENDKPYINGSKLTQEQLQQDLNYILAQKITKKMLDKGMISIDEFNKISERNCKIFSPYLSEIMP